MIRREYRLEIVWPSGHRYPKHFRRVDAAQLAQRLYEADGARVTIEVWGHSGEDLSAGWYRDAKLTQAYHRADRDRDGPLGA